MSAIRIISCASSDLVSDQRVHRTCKLLTDMGFEVCSVGRRKKTSLELGERTYSTKRFRLLAEKGPVFYAVLNIRLLIYLLSSRMDIILSNDLDTLPACSMAAMIRRKKLVYDSHEYFTEVPELINRRFTRSVWILLEKLFIRVPKEHFTVSPSIAREYHEKYGVDFTVIRNLPEYIADSELHELRSQSSLESRSGKVILYQGSVNVDRGLEEMVEAMAFIPNADLFIAGDGDILEELKLKTSKLEWAARIHFLGKIPFADLPGITASADLGISLEKLTGKSYSYALPNKVFDYAMAGIPVIMSALEELKPINDQYHFGVFINDHDPVHLAEKVIGVLENKEVYQKLASGARRMAEELNWGKESEKLRTVFSALTGQ